MRQLHPVALQERFAGSGVYRLAQNDHLTETTEAWTIHRLPDNSLLIRVDQDSGRDEFSILLEALLSSNGAFERFDVRVDRYSPSEAKQIKATYQFFDKYVEIGWQVNGMARNEDSVQLPDGAVIYPGMWVFTGNVIKQIEQRQDQQAPLFFVDLYGLKELKAIKGQIRNCSVKELDRDNSTAEQTLLQVYQLSGMGFRNQAQFWLDEHDMLVNYSDEQRRVVLTRYAPFSKKRS